MLSKIFIKTSNIIIALTLVIMSCGFNLISIPSFAQSGDQSNNCDDVRFIFARGSGETINGPSMTAWREEIISAIGETTADFSYSFYELGSQPQDDYQYPAVAVSDSLGGYINLVGAYFSGGEAFQFGASVEEGINELRTYVASVSESCSQTKFVLGGYSQGAMVLSASLSSLDATKIVYVSTFGDPKLYLPEGKPTFLGIIPKTPDACLGLNLSSYRISVPDCRAYEGVLGSYRPYQPGAYAGKLGTWCNEKDIMCSSGASISDHTAYASSNLYRDAASVIARKLSRAFPNRVHWADALKNAKHNVAFVIDTTFSMSSMIDKYKTEAKKLAARVESDGGSVAMFEYRDLNEGFQTRQLCDFSCGLDELNSQIDSLVTKGGGSDIIESALSALLTAMNSLDWQPGATKSIILLTDAGYHIPDYDGTTFADVVQRSLEIDPVNIFVVTSEKSSSNPHLQNLADATSGQVFALGRTEPSITTEVILNRPVARLALSSYAGQVGDELYFDASASYSANSEIVRYDWDLDGDGDFELADSGSTISYVYNQETSHIIQVRVVDSLGSVSTMSAQVSITSEPVMLPIITNLEATPQPDDSILVTFESSGEKALLVTGELVRGFVEIKNSAGSFTMHEVPEDLAVTLIPYSAAGERGLADSILIPATGNELPVPEVPKTPEAPKAPETTENEKFPETPEIPKAPNTGLVNHRYR